MGQPNVRPLLCGRIPAALHRVNDHCRRCLGPVEGLLRRSPIRAPCWAWVGQWFVDNRREPRPGYGGGGGGWICNCEPSGHRSALLTRRLPPPFSPPVIFSPPVNGSGPAGWLRRPGAVLPPSLPSHPCTIPRPAGYFRSAHRQGIYKQLWVSRSAPFFVSIPIF